MRVEFPKSCENALNPEVFVEAGTRATQEEGRFQCAWEDETKDKLILDFGMLCLINLSM